MKLYCAILAFAFAYHMAEADEFALLIAGSNGYHNYRHQADVCHAYQLLRKHGIPERNIVVMMYDDIANSYRNPYKGNIINKPHGDNVYPGVPHDYTGSEVNKENFLNVLQGNEKAMTGIGSEKVIASGADDNIFVFYSDHGGYGLVGMPRSSPLYASEINSAIKSMFSQKKYNQLVIYMEACFAGSMFYNRLADDMNAYVVTASNRHESSYACYWDGHRHAYLGDLFSVNWMKDSTGANMTARSLREQYLKVKEMTRMSHVTEFGDVKMRNLSIGNFQGEHSLRSEKISNKAPLTDAVPALDVPYMLLKQELQDAKTTEERLDILKRIQIEEEARFTARADLLKIAGKIVPDANRMLTFDSTEITEDQEQCYKEVTLRYRDVCIDFVEFEYALQDLHVFANLCRRSSVERIFAALDDVCR